MKNKRIKKKLVLKRNVEIFINKCLILTIIILCILIMIKKNNKLKDTIITNIYEKSFQFTKARNLYNKYLGNIFPINNILQEEKPVFNEKLAYKKQIKRKNGVELQVDKNYMVPTLEGGVVVFIGEKDSLGKTVIIEQVNGIACIYSNINFIDINLYDYIEKGQLLGEAIDNKIILSFVKEGKYLDYKKYI